LPQRWRQGPRSRPVAPAASCQVPWCCCGDAACCKLSGALVLLW
jgi:hypothetical protein